MKKITVLSLCVLLLFSLLLLPASAEEITGEAPLGFTQAVTDFLTQNGDTLLGVLSLIGTLLVAFLYKTGLLPLLRSGLSALSDLLGKNREVTEHFTKETGEQIHRIEEYMTPMVDTLARSENALRAMEEKLAALETALERSEGDRQKTAAVLRTETELFYELLASVNLPETQKDSMTESYYRLKRILEAEE
ncbi:MAG: hypothetical protein E7657_00775 [Ruminococcaceae bacterium]|nr:hypothetical protein [Oscillospiraceae bacterium]